MVWCIHLWACGRAIRKADGRWSSCTSRSHWTWRRTLGRGSAPSSRFLRSNWSNLERPPQTDAACDSPENQRYSQVSILRSWISQDFWLKSLMLWQSHDSADQLKVTGVISFQIFPRWNPSVFACLFRLFLCRPVFKKQRVHRVLPCKRAFSLRGQNCCFGID